MDAVDLTNDRIETLTKMTIEQIRRRATGGKSATFCDMCGMVIPEGRRGAQPGCSLCVLCQEEAERG